MRARDAVESNPYDMASYTVFDQEKLQEKNGAPDEYTIMLLTIQIQLDRINIDNKAPTAVNIMALRYIADLATQASKIKDTTK